MIFYNEAAGWSCFGLILAVLIAFIAHHYWKKNKGDSKISSFKPTDDGYENLKFEKQRVEDQNEQLEKEIKETKEKLEELQESVKLKQELEIQLSALKARYQALISNYEFNIVELEKLRKEKENLNKENVRLFNKETELTQKVIERDNLIRDKLESLEIKNEQVEKQELLISKLQKEVKTLEVEKQELLTRQDNLKEQKRELDEKFNELQNEWKRLNETQINLLRENTELTERKKYLEEETRLLEKRYESSWNFYESLRNSGLETNISELLRYKQFHNEYFEIIQIQKRKEEEDRDRISAGRNYERSWQSDLEKLFTAEELRFIDIIPQPEVEGKRGDYKISFRDSKNAATTENQLNIYVEHKYTSKKENTLGEFNSIKDERMNEDLRVARDNATKEGDYDFIFLITNREIGQDQFREKGFFWINADKDYQFFGLKPPSKNLSGPQQVKPAIVIMTREKSFEFLWNLYTLWKNWSSLNIIRESDLLLKNVNEVFTSPEFKRDLVKWVNDSDEFNLEVGEKMEKQWVELVSRVRIISEFWAKKKKQAYKLNTRAIKLRRSSDWVAEDEDSKDMSSELTESEKLDSLNKREIQIKKKLDLELKTPIVLGEKSFSNNISHEGDSLK